MKDNSLRHGVVTRSKLGPVFSGTPRIDPVKMLNYVLLFLVVLCCCVVVVVEG